MQTVIRYLGAVSRAGRVATCVFALIVPFTVQAQTVEEVAAQIAVGLRQQYSTDEQLDAAISRTYGVRLPADKAEVARRSMRSLIAHPAVPLYMANLMLPVYRPGISREELTAATLEGFAQLQVKGLARLAPERQAMFVRHMLDMVRAIPASQCKVMFLGQMSTAESAELERRYVVGLPLGKFEGITSMYKDAVDAELNGYPDARTINAQQAKIAEQVYEAAATKRISAQVPLAAVQRVNQDAASAPAAEVCALMSATIEGMLDIPEPYRFWQLTRFTQSLL